jgi:hypothetical protein
MLQLARVNGTGVTRSILHLPAMLRALDEPEREVFNRIFHVSHSVGQLVAPATMEPWIKKLFGSVEAVETQRILKTTNLITMEGTLFNALRASRPFESRHSDNLDTLVNEGLGDPFCKPLEGTPEDVFGRVRGEHSITASNVAKYDAFHGVVIFDHHNPLEFDEASISDAIDVGLQWGQRAVETDPAAKYWFFMWNCLWKSGASILHGHAQVASTREMHYPKVEALRREAVAYRDRYGNNYFDDLIAAHRCVGLVSQIGDTAIVTSVTPIKEKETLIIAPALTRDLRYCIGHVLDRMVYRLGVTSFNLVIYLPPLAEAPEDWSGFPAMVRIVDRGEPNNKTADIGAMELYAASVVSSDPYRVADALHP